MRLMVSCGAPGRFERRRSPAWAALLLCGLLSGAGAHAQRAAPAEEGRVVDFQVQSITALVDRPSYRAPPRRARGDRLGQRHQGRLPLRAHFRARAAASAGAL